MDEVRFWVGVDWGSETHQVCVMDSTRKVILECAVAHSGEALVGLTEKLIAMAGGRPGLVGVAIEVPRGPVVETLLEKGISVFAINPKQLDRFRDRHSVAGAKDDRRDAFVLADSLRTNPSALSRLQRRPCQPSARKGVGRSSQAMRAAAARRAREA